MFCAVVAGEHVDPSSFPDLTSVPAPLDIIVTHNHLTIPPAVYVLFGSTVNYIRQVLLVFSPTLAY